MPRRTSGRLPPYDAHQYDGGTGERRGPGGLRGLQNRCGAARAVLGGFDSHALPPPLLYRASAGRELILCARGRSVLLLVTRVYCHGTRPRGTGTAPLFAISAVDNSM